MGPGPQGRVRVSSRHELVPPVALRIQQRREVAVVDPRGGSAATAGLA